MNQHTPLHEQHIEAGGRMVDFAGWDMPLHYGSQIEEHHRVRRDAGLFDVSHMTVIDLKGGGARAFLRGLIANNVDRLTAPGRALYTCMLREDGGVLDDLIVYLLADTWFRLIVNAGTTLKDLAWIRGQAQGLAVSVHERRDLAILAVQGPNARDKVFAALGDHLRQPGEALKPFHAFLVGEMMITATGYTGEDGFEIILPAQAAPSAWAALAGAGVAPCGLGARDTLRLEAGMNLYGQDMGEDVTPLESGLAWTVALEPPERGFIGRAALERQRAEGVGRNLFGLLLEDKGVLRAHQRVRVPGGGAGAGEGEITSGGFAPTLDRSIALARLPAMTRVGARCEVEVRGRWLAARIVKYPFIRHGKCCLDV